MKRLSGLIILLVFFLARNGTLHSANARAKMTQPCAWGPKARP